MKFAETAICKFLCFILFLKVRKNVHSDLDYEEYLGPSYLNDARLEEKNTSTIVCNHISNLDILVIYSQVYCTFISNEN